MILPPGFVDARKIGSGGLGDVYLATRSSTGGDVAVKVLRQQGGQDAVLRRARRERDALSSLRGHPNVVHLEDVLETADGQVLLVMEYMSGGSIDEYAERQGGTLTTAQVILVGEQAAAALSAAHGLGVVHRDIKPQNLLINSFGHVKVCDFGISSLGSSTEFAERTDALSYRYASPEELRGDEHIPPLTDVYSLGVTLAALLTGRFLTHETASRLLDEASTPSATGEITPVERELRELIVTCLAGDLAGRPDSEQLTRRLSSLGAELGPDRARRLPMTAGAPGPLAAAVPQDDATIAGLDPTTLQPASPPPLAAMGPSRRPTAAARRRRSPVVGVLWILVAVIALAIAVVVFLIVTEESDAVEGLGSQVANAHSAGDPIGPPAPAALPR